MHEPLTKSATERSLQQPFCEYRESTQKIVQNSDTRESNRLRLKSVFVETVMLSPKNLATHFVILNWAV